MQCMGPVPGEMKALEHGGSTGTSDQQAGLVFNGFEFNVVHDDEALEQIDQVRYLRTISFEEQGIFKQERCGVALNAPLRVQEEVITTLAGCQRQDRVGDHAVQPAYPVFASDPDPGQVRKWRNRNAFEQGRKSCRRVAGPHDCGVES